MSDEDKTGKGKIEVELAECEDQVDHLKRENRLLRAASTTFGALAERLNASLESERRRGADRRSLTRASEDRRQPSVAGETSRR